MKTMFSRFIREEAGATAIEYGLIASLVAVAIIAGLMALGPKLGEMFTSIAGKVTPAT